MLLTVTPPMIEDECLPSYLLRLTQRNGFRTITDWLSPQTFHAATTENLSLRHLNELMTKVGISPDINHCSFSGNLSPLFTCPKFTQPRVCPECVNGNGYIKREWLSLNNLICYEHNCLLVDYCSHCEQQLIWDSKLLTKTCSTPDCGQPITSPHLGTLPVHLTTQQISDCLVAQFFYHTPDATMLPKPNHFEMNNYNEQLKNGHNLLTNCEIFDSWCYDFNQQSLKHSEYPEDIKLYPWLLFNENIQFQWPNMNIGKNREFKTIPSKPGYYAAPFKTSAKQLMKSLGISTFQLRDVLSVIDHEFQSNKRISMKRHLDLAALSSHLTNNSTIVKQGVTILAFTSGDAHKMTSTYIEILSGKTPFNYSPKESYKTSITI